MSIEPAIQELIERKLIKQEKIRDEQIVKLLERSCKDLNTAKAILKSEIDEEAAFTYAYLTMLRAGRALMFSYGYRPIDGLQHWTVGEFAKRALGISFENIAQEFDAMRRERNRFTYDPNIPVSEVEAQDAIKAAEECLTFIADKIIEWRPDLEKSITVK